MKSFGTIIALESFLRLDWANDTSTTKMDKESIEVSPGHNPEAQAVI